MAEKPVKFNCTEIKPALAASSSALGPLLPIYFSCLFFYVLIRFYDKQKGSQCDIHDLHSSVMTHSSTLSHEQTLLLYYTILQLLYTDKDLESIF